MLMGPKTANVQTPLMQTMRRGFSGTAGAGPSKLAGGCAAFATLGLTALMYKGHQTRMQMLQSPEM